CSGFKQLTRISDTNHFNRQPIATLPLENDSPILLSDLEFVRKKTSLPIVMCLPGPYSLACQTQNVLEIGQKELAFEYAKVLRQEIGELLSAGAAMVRIEDPLILENPHDSDLFRELSHALTEGLDQSKIALATWFGDADKIPGFFDLPFGIFFVDFIQGPWNLQSLKKFPSEKKLVVGLFDGRQPFKEPEEQLETKLGYVSQYIDRERIMLSANTDLHFLPWDKSLQKAKTMVDFATGCGNKKTFVMGFIPTTLYVQVGLSKKASDSNKPLVAKLPRIPFPTSTVGSFPQTKEIRSARREFHNGKMSRDVYRKLVEERTRRCVEYQIKGLDITYPVGGEFLRGDMAAFFGEQIGGKKCDRVPSYENRFYNPIEYSREIHLASNPMTVDDFKFVQSLTDKPVKETITGPVTMTDWGLISHHKYYYDRRAFRMAFVSALRKEMEEMLAAGVKILQIDEPALTAKMKQFDLDIEALHEVVSGFEDKFYLILHVCYSDIRSLDAAFSEILQLPFHQVHMEMANRGFKMFELIEKHGFGGKDIGLGVIDVHTDRIETVDEVVETVRRARKYFSPEQIFINPDCGLKERSDEIAEKKLLVMAQAAERCRKELI
ncbi:MAG: hypothetical protein Q7R94_00025, partial [bacterium]|nr:hypothetical protein [bacterium]